MSLDLDKLVEQANEAHNGHTLMKIEGKVILELIGRLRAFKIIGTDGCRRCETGRVSLWSNRDICLECSSPMGKQ